MTDVPRRLPPGHHERIRTLVDRMMPGALLGGSRTVGPVSSVPSAPQLASVNLGDGHFLPISTVQFAGTVHCPAGSAGLWVFNLGTATVTYTSGNVSWCNATSPDGDVLLDDNGLYTDAGYFTAYGTTNPLLTIRVNPSPYGSGPGFPANPSGVTGEVPAVIFGGHQVGHWSQTIGTGPGSTTHVFYALRANVNATVAFDVQFSVTLSRIG